MAMLRIFWLIKNVSLGVSAEGDAEASDFYRKSKAFTGGRRLIEEVLRRLVVTLTFVFVVAVSSTITATLALAARRRIDAGLRHRIAGLRYAAAGPLTNTDNDADGNDGD